jgi:tRNA threonylcarbamoyladenosine biosynthesis protein TsaB
MAIILCIETATEICSVALLQDDKILALQENHEGNSHASQITLLIDAVMKDANIELKNLDAIAVSKGPGSYTGLRVGVSTAKGLCYALDIPLIAINTLESLTHETINKAKGKGQKANFCSMIDARRMEVYCAVFDEQMNTIQKTEAKIIDENSFSDLFETSTIYFFGNGSSKCKNIITHKNAIFIDDIKCSAANMNGIAQKLFHEKQFEDVAYFEPFYLKDFVGTVPNKK